MQTSTFQNKLPQVGRAQNSQSHSNEDSLTDSGGGKRPIKHTRNGQTHTHKINIATYNIRTMRTDDHLVELEQELQAIKWDIVGLCETRRKGEMKTTLRSGHTLYQNNSETDYSQGGVAFMVNRQIEHQIMKYSAISDRVIYLILKLNNRYNLQLIHCYAPTSTADDEVVDELYEDITRARNLERAQFVVVTGDFNAKIGEKQLGDSFYIGNYGLGQRNDRGDTLVNYINAEKLFCLNTFYKKQQQRRWTWRSPDGQSKNEIDFILANDRKICTDVSVLNRFNTGSDHRLVRANIQISTKTERRKLLLEKRFPTSKVLATYSDTFEKEITQKLNPYMLQNRSIDELTQKITKDIQTATKKICSKVKNKKEVKLGPETIKQIEKRRETEKDHPEYREINKLVKKNIRKDLRTYRTKKILETIENNKNMKVLKTSRTSGRQRMTKIRDEHNNLVYHKEEITKQIQRFYENLYKSTSPNQEETSRHILNVGSEDLPEITQAEIRNALQQMKDGKAAGEDRISTEMLKMGGPTLQEAIKTLLNKCLAEGKIPKSWKNAEVILIHKKGDNTNIENYRPISLLSHLYKLLTKIITNRLTTKLDSYQPIEQAGFRKGFGTINHLQTIRAAIEKTTEYNIPLHLAFIDYHKAFDSIETWAFLNALDDARIDTRYTTIIKDIYQEATFHIKIDNDLQTDKIKLGKGVRQGDTISPKLFTLALENVFKRLNWEGKGLKIDGTFLNHLRFADDIVLISTDIGELNAMMHDLNEKSKEIGLKMNLSKTKVMTNTQNIITVDNTIIEKVEQYVYLGHIIKNGKENQLAEIKRRIKLTWAAFGKLSFILKDKNIPMHLKRKTYDSCILPVATYGLETMAITRKTAEELRVAQRAMERAMLGISLREKIPNTEIRRRTGVTDIMEQIARQKWRWTGHIARRDEERWEHRLTFWRPRGTKRSIGRPKKRYTDDVAAIAGRQWMRVARDREAWKGLEEAYIQHWMNQG